MLSSPKGAPRGGPKWSKLANSKLFNWARLSLCSAEKRPSHQALGPSKAGGGRPGAGIGPSSGGHPKRGLFKARPATRTASKSPGCRIQTVSVGPREAALAKGTVQGTVQRDGPREHLEPVEVRLAGPSDGLESVSAVERAVDRAESRPLSGKPSPGQSRNRPGGRRRAVFGLDPEEGLDPFAEYGPCRIRTVYGLLGSWGVRGVVSDL
mmetsp:Transcript_9481/g.33362  ORF Transcript_9481/g.33362 Transcript_9481/m.33362 type:complete len:209 (-) Transcript_9481:85-711(-)